MALSVGVLLARAQRHLQDVGDAFTQMEAEKDNPHWEEVTRLANEIIKDKVQEIRTYLRQNYLAAGLRPSSPNKDNRGHAGIFNAVGNAEVWIRASKGKITLCLGLPGVENARTPVALTSLEYGAVNMPHETMRLIDLSQRKVVGKSKRAPFGQKLKKTVKRFALQHIPVPGRSKKYMETAFPYATSKLVYHRKAFKNLKVGYTTSKGTVHLSHGISVRKAHNFFQLLPGQMDSIRKYLFEELNKRLKES
jgi:hypothetical protein